MGRVSPQLRAGWATMQDVTAGDMAGPPERGQGSGMSKPSSGAGRDSGSLSTVSGRQEEWIWQDD